MAYQQRKIEEAIDGFPTYKSTNVPTLFDIAKDLTLVDRERYSDRVNNQLQILRFDLRTWAKEVTQNDYLPAVQIELLRRTFDQRFEEFVAVCYVLMF
jgi:hypothetical protein